ncbi:tellurite resistance TerB family protein [Oryzifoliimicrobium ureilyticus]|uniref:tellurite resistance TerB family protein n=1 Tax=Oryzifoliimicrobium ureilyticus TaxID=3113724 RepID=UPI003076624A
MFDAKKLLDQFLGASSGKGGDGLRQKAGEALAYAQNNPMKTGALAAALLGTKTGRKLAGSAVKIGSVAAVAGLGYLAYRNWQSGKTPQETAGAARSVDPATLPVPEQSGFGPSSPDGSNEFVLVLVRAMIAAAKADGHIDAAERSAIAEKMRSEEIDGEAAAFIERELSAPTDLDSMLAAAVTEEQRVELYTVSRLTIEPDTRAERGYLDLLAGRLGLDDKLVDHIDASVTAHKAQIASS